MFKKIIKKIVAKVFGSRKVSEVVESTPEYIKRRKHYTITRPQEITPAFKYEEEAIQEAPQHDFKMSWKEWKEQNKQIDTYFGVKNNTSTLRLVS